MTPGPNQIIACPHCRALARYETIESGNTFGAMLYSDGKQVAPMLPYPPPFIECPACQKTYWLQDAPEVGTLDPRSSKPSRQPEWLESPFIQAPSEEKMYAVIDTYSKGNTSELRQMRILAWYTRNDPYRADSTLPLQITESARKNMSDLSLQLQESSAQSDQDMAPNLLMECELMREQELFEKASERLEKVQWGDLQSFADQIKSECQKRNARVVALKV